jgi:DNA-binding CsgD family transcriptional regulator
MGDRGLRGRDQETAALGGLLCAARDGRSGVLVLRGDPGIGKTALLESTVGAAEGFRVLRARGVEPESEIAFAALQELFGPVSSALGALPDRQRAVLAGALALGPPVPGDPLAVRVATLSLLAAVAETGPLLTVIDDAHWLDSPSAEALAFAARRLDHEGVVVLFAMRSAEPSAFDPSELQVLEVLGLTDSPAREVLADRLGGEVRPSVARAVVEVAGGNPLALGELSRMLNAAQLAGREPLPEPLLAGTGLERAFARRLVPLSEQTQAALLLAAASPQDDAGTIAGALRAGGLSPRAFDPAEEAGLVTIGDGVVRFYHPLLRSVVYQRASGDQRRSAHAALAAASDGITDRRAWHLAAACLGADEGVAAALDDAAGRAAARGGLSTAAHTYARAAALSANTDTRCRRLLNAANLALAAGRPEWAAALADEGLPLAEASATRADFDHLAAAAERARGSAARARAMLWDGATRATAQDPTRAVAMLIDATMTDCMRGDQLAAAASAGRARELAQSCSAALRSFADVNAAIVACIRGELTAAEYETARTRAAGASTVELPAPAAMAVEMVVENGRALFDPSEGGRAEGFDAPIAAARQRGDLGQVPFLLGQAAHVDRREGSWTRGWSRAMEAAELAGSTGQWTFRAFALVTTAYIEAAQGLEADCREHSAEVLRLAQEYDIGSLEVYVSSVAGLLELSLGNIPEAVERLERCSRQAARAHLGHPPSVPYEPDLVEALWAAGCHQDARAAADLLSERAQRCGSPWGLATASRCRGLLAGEDEFEHEFLGALALHDRVPSAFERARTQLCFGERLRRGRRRADARQHLGSALAVFDQFEATPWAARARRELQATGATARPRRDPTTADRLTAQELRVSLMIADGATNREAAAQLFLSPKTIEAHLGRAYRKLGVHNRAQLASTLTRQAAA